MAGTTPFVPASVGALEGAPLVLAGVRRVEASFPSHVHLIWYFWGLVIIQVFLQMSHGLMGEFTCKMYDYRWINILRLQSLASRLHKGGRAVEVVDVEEVRSRMPQVLPPFRSPPVLPVMAVVVVVVGVLIHDGQWQ
jgi:hypothetical protein